MTNGLTKSQVARKNQLVKRVKDGLTTFLEVGNALKVLRDENLYRDTHKTFEAFMRAEFELSKSVGYYYIQSAETHSKLSSIEDKSDFGNLPRLSSHYREIVKAPVEKLPEVLARVAERTERTGRPPRAKDFKAAVSMVVEGTVIKRDSSKTKEPPKDTKDEPEPSKEEQMKAEQKKARSYAEYLQRSIDDLNRIKRNTVQHPELIKLCGQILKRLARW